MNIGFCLFSYFPYGGLQRDFRRIAEGCRDRGHTVTVFSAQWTGEIPEGFIYVPVPPRGRSNHARMLHFAEDLLCLNEAHSQDMLVGFNKMPGLDVYYAADPCYRYKAMHAKGMFYRLTPRYRTYELLERAVFSPDSATVILLIAEAEQDRYRESYGTPAERFRMLPPGISRDRLAPDNAAVVREETRTMLGISPAEKILLLVGSGFRTKGLDRALVALSHLPVTLRAQTRLLIAGSGDPAPFLKLARRQSVAERVAFLGGRDDVAQLLLAADILIHPAYSENTGTVLLEAMAAGLPVLATDVCGYAPHIVRADAGKVLPSPYRQEAFDALLAEMLVSPFLHRWGVNGNDYAKTHDLYSMPEKAVGIIEAAGRERR